MKRLAIIDWDDTVFPRTALCGRASDKLDEDVALQAKDELASLEDALFTALLQFGSDGFEVVIVTNAAGYWPEFSASRYMPRLWKHMQEHKVEIVSAADRYRDLWPDNPLDWKAHLFVWLITERVARCAHTPDFVPERPLELLVIGDSQAEEVAASRVHKLGVILRYIKLLSYPTVKTLTGQWKTLVKWLSSLLKPEQSTQLIFSDNEDEENTKQESIGSSQELVVSA